MSYPSVVFGLQDLPRPPKMGFFYCTLSSKFSEFHTKTLANLDLYNTDEEYLANIFREGIKNMLHDEHLEKNITYSILQNHATENIKKFAQKILQKVIDEYIIDI